MKKLSFIIPVYNIKNYIKKCLDSILLQIDSNFEIIIVNDGSTDNVTDILTVYERQYDFIKIINKKNGGLSSARNAGMQAATGRYIWFVDGDDTIFPNAISTIEPLLDEEYSIIFFDYNKQYEDYNQLVIDNYHKRLNYNSRILINTSPCTKIFNKNFLNEYNAKFDEGIIYEDLALIPFLVSRSNSSYYVSQPLYNYFYRSNSIMNSNKQFHVNRDDKFKAINNLMNRFKKQQIYDTYFTELEYLQIRHLVFTYSSEILPFSRKVYLNRCDKVNNKMNKLNKNWFNNAYLKSESIYKKIYIFFFRKRCYFICKIIVSLLRKVGRI